MRTKNFAAGLVSLFLVLLAGCGSVLRSPEPPPTVSGCPVVVPCQLPATKPARNGHLLTDQERTELAWAECAAQVDAVFQYQVTHEQTR
ncbi:Rz1-like lysis system protein LysC [Pseudomonas sp. 02C 26]|uniref:Rz1-like lysis system protein LysC n=1 Tax=Pseudomonas sp. 02C 26 TaxID=2054914 RepID=UPI001C442A67|nr:Rz1-like lysis system protein LysC [Pseudomonas sp. 02C 26]